MNNTMKDTVLKTAVNALDQKKGHDIQVIEVEKLTIVSSYFVIASGTSTTQVKALADEVEFQLKEAGIAPHRIEGYTASNWIVLDYGVAIVHVFLNETREFYQLEKLWADGIHHNVNDYIIDNAQA